MQQALPPCEAHIGDEASHAVRAEIAELILERAGPVIFLMTLLLLALNSFRLIPVICPAKEAKPENCWKR